MAFNDDEANSTKAACRLAPLAVPHAAPTVMQPRLSWFSELTQTMEGTHFRNFVVTVISQDNPQQVNQLRTMVEVRDGKAVRQRIQFWGSRDLHNNCQYMVLAVECTCSRRVNNAVRACPLTLNAWTSSHVLPLD